MKKKTTIIISIIIGLTAAFTIGAITTETKAEIQEAIAQEVIRFHVRANSDSAEDQEIKMEVKNEVVEYLSPILATAKNQEETRALILKEMQNIESISNRTLQEHGCNYGATVRLGDSDFPEKTYGDMRFPAGSYEALIISLGSGEGHNWWCMLYPSLCFFTETYAVVQEEKKEELQNMLTEQEFSWITNTKEVRIDFKWF